MLSWNRRTWSLFAVLLLVGCIDSRSASKEAALVRTEVVATDECGGGADGKGPKVIVFAGPLIVEVAREDGTTFIAEVPVPNVEVELVDTSNEDVPRRGRTPAMDVAIPEGPSRAPTPVSEVELPTCTPGTPVRVRTPVTQVQVPDTSSDVPRRVGVPAMDVTVVDPNTVARRVRVPVMEQVVQDGDVARRIATPAIEVEPLPPETPNIATRVRVQVPTQEEDQTARRVRVRVSSPNE